MHLHLQFIYHFVDIDCELIYTNFSRCVTSNCIYTRS